MSGAFHEVDFDPGQHISSAAKRLIASVPSRGWTKARGTFNGIELIAGDGTTADEVVAAYEAEVDRRQKAYRTSPEGIAAEAERDARRAALQATHDGLMSELRTLNMQDDVAVLDWLCAMQEPSDYVGVIVKRQTIVSKFEASGYRANENTGTDYRPGNRSNMFRYLVGQALSGLKEGPAIHPILRGFVEKWKREFSPPITSGDSHPGKAGMVQS